MLRNFYGTEVFFPVPDEDSGDRGIEFYTNTGLIFQCYYPEKKYEMKEYKRKIQGKINDDLKKLKSNEKEIGKWLDNVKIHQWILLTPENKSKDFLAYCTRKKKETIDRNISFIDNENFSVKIETAESYPSSMRYAIKYDPDIIDIPSLDINSEYINEWKINNSNSDFLSNINRKSKLVRGDAPDKFQDLVIEKYIQLDNFNDKLKDEHPDLYNQINNTSFALLEEIRINQTINGDIVGKELISKIIKNNSEMFGKYLKDMSDKNVQLLPFGYLSKWIAHCFMDFE
ncbi:MAG: hypothetical protein D3914_01800 [Candidatus Electrothrix sp. LOE2]|nr:hypothetical protein [Candidatus Electrothrix sp. LOE2]